MASAEVVWNDANLHFLFASHQGDVAKDLTRRALAVEAKAKRLCPVDTGRLRASITHEIRSTATEVYALVGTDVHYAPYVEFGTRFMAAQPFLRPALSAAGPEYVT